MKSIKILALSLFTIFLSSCSDELFDIKFGLQSQEVFYTLKPTSTAGVIPLDTAFESINLDSFATVNGVKDMSKLKSLKIKKINISIVTPATANFNIVSSGYLKIGADQLPTVEIAKIESIPNNSTSFDITPADVNLLDYGRKPKLFTFGQLVTTGPVMEEIKLKFVIDYEAIANPTN